MADTNDTTNTALLSRRSALAMIGAGAATVASTAALCTLPATASPAVIRPEWAALEEEVVAASDAYYEAMSAPKMPTEPSRLGKLPIHFPNSATGRKAIPQPAAGIRVRPGALHALELKLRATRDLLPV
jgi:hypothetical protein